MVLPATKPVSARRRPAPAAPSEAMPAPEPLGRPLACELVLRLPLPLLRYRQRLEEHGPIAGPERIEGPGLPQDHVLYRTLPF